MFSCSFYRTMLVLVSLLFYTIAPAAANPPPVLKAKAAVLIDAATGQILYGKNSEAAMYPASTTKIMSLIVALKHGKLDDIVTASENAVNTEGSSLELAVGEQLTMLQLLYGMMMISGNDATVAVAEHIAGSVDNFAKLMTQEAQQLGAVHTNFTNSSGLPDPQHVTTAYDLARITAYGYKLPLFAEIVGSKHKIIPWEGGRVAQRDLYNENRMLWLYNGANGVKTGYTDAAGRCLVSGASRNGLQLVAVVLDSDTMWDDSIALLNYGFSQVTPQILFNRDDVLKTMRVLNGKSETVALAASRDFVLPQFANPELSGTLSTVIDTPARLEAPIQPGQKIGAAKIMYNGQEIDHVDLIATEGVERKSLFGMLAKFFMNIVAAISNKLQGA